MTTRSVHSNGWQATFTSLRLAPDAPVLTLPFPSGFHSQVLRWQGDTDWPGSMIGGYFLGPGPTGQASFFFDSYRTPETIVATYLNELWLEGIHEAHLAQNSVPPSGTGGPPRSWWSPVSSLRLYGS